MEKMFSDTIRRIYIKCLIVDNEKSDIYKIEHCLKENEVFQVVDTCFSSFEAMEVLRKKEVDLMFFGINSIQRSGLDFIKTLENPPKVILTSVYSKYAFDAFRLNAIDFLLKPFSYNIIDQAIQKAIEFFETKRLREQSKTNKITNIYIRQGDVFQQIICNEIILVRAMQNYQILFMKRKKYIIHQTMAVLDALLPAEYFFRVHNSYFINTNFIEYVYKNSIMIHGEEIPISRSRKSEFMNSVVYKNLISKNNQFKNQMLI